ncbi:general stress protein, partial [Staphylococcus succinus]
MKPVIKAYVNVDELEVDIKTLKDQGVNVQNIYVLLKNSEYISNI